MDERVMRAMMASGMVPSATAGRIRWRHRRPERAVLVGQQGVDQHEAGFVLDPEDRRDMRPDTGVQPRLTEKNRTSSSAHQKIGMEKPVTATPMTA